MTRDEQLKDFFRRFDQMTDADAQEVQQMAFDLDITFAELQANAEQKKARQEASYARSPF